ncbi:DinB/UmuC family translesion DNA polymerase [Streptomyces cyaneofuscatus]|uniref:DinB/UmuC family translesion DNA polymerase n=1 Tax=Streptomyces cyaneofuscatus TaxID=66883 RepID=UPI003427F0D7
MNTTLDQRHLVHLRFQLPEQPHPDILTDLKQLLEQITPKVQMLPPDSAILDVTGAIRFWERDAAALARLAQLRTAAHHGLRTAAATAPTLMLAAMACALTPPGQLTTIDPTATRSFLRPRPVRELPGIGPRTARLLTDYGLHTIGDLADTPLLTVQRLLGASTGRTLHDRAHGRDLRAVNPQPTARSASAEHRFPHDELSPERHRQALLALTDHLGYQLRTTGQATARLTITVRYADSSTTTRQQALAEPSNHTANLARTAYDLYGKLGLQRARVRSITVRCEQLMDAARATEQLSLDPHRTSVLVAEGAIDALNRRFGPGTVRSAATYGRAV